MMVDARYKEGSEKCCELHNVEGHVISHCEGFHKKSDENDESWVATN
jgi:hypothetical protein